MKIEGGVNSPGYGEGQSETFSKPLVQHGFERLLARTDEPTLFERWKQGSALESLLQGASSAVQRDLLWQIHQQGGEQAKLVGSQLFQPVIDKLIAHFSGRQLPVVAAIDLPELRALMREFDPLPSRREKVLLNVMADLKKVATGDQTDLIYLDELARRELMTLIPLNGMVNNLMRHSHKLDLEA
ncbi:MULTISPECIES: YopR family T3SS polymerization control protein [Aeromonas]|uniref:YopR family T3SS polymerization control protein n=1 Tax=Aeromonas TaxID=642 RepID=UPI00244AC04B|nr:YopR family T3SS polymerization control protein [Aeromonas dhakensis]MDH0345944.1 YopR family T3SS polymerization control protein [Aeromonas dhakensis]